MNIRIPVIVVSGFLGSGKTTFLRYLLKNSKKKFGLLINEFGDVGIDGDLIKSCNGCNLPSEECVIELNNGCLCCTVQDDFIPSIKALLKLKSGLEAIIIETSGLALPIPLLKALNWPEIRSSVYLDTVIGIVNGESMLNNSPIDDLKQITDQYDKTKIIEHNSSIDELFEEQLEVADVILISRADLLTDNSFKKVKVKIQDKLKTNVPIIKSLNGKINLAYIFDSSFKKDKHQKLISDEHKHNHAELFSDSIRSPHYLDKKSFDLVMAEIIKDLKILRIKGRVWIPNKSLPLQIQIVGRKIHTWYEEAPIDCWRPTNKSGLEIIMIGFDESSFVTLKEKIKEKFNIFSDTKSVI